MLTSFLQLYVKGKMLHVNNLVTLIILTQKVCGKQQNTALISWSITEQTNKMCTSLPIQLFLTEVAFSIINMYLLFNN